MQTPPRREMRRLSLESGAFDPTRVLIEKVDVEAWEGAPKFVYYLHNIMTPQECQRCIDESEAYGYDAALLNETLETDIRKHSRCIIDDQMFAAELCRRISAACASHTPSPITIEPFQSENIELVGLNERLRVLRYDPGEYFKPHCDGQYVDGEKGVYTLVTSQLYLNEGFTGGSTNLVTVDFKGHGSISTSEQYDVAVQHAVVPRTGSVLLFQHDCLHEGEELVSGRKYTIRTDFLYKDK
jgi:hypothetical protein